MLQYRKEICVKQNIVEISEFAKEVEFLTCNTHIRRYRWTKAGLWTEWKGRSQLSTSIHALIYFSLLLRVTIMWLSASGSCHPGFCTIMECNLKVRPNKPFLSFVALVGYFMTVTENKLIRVLYPSSKLYHKSHSNWSTVKKAVMYFSLNLEGESTKTNP